MDGAPWKRFGGCGTDLIVDLSRCDLFKASFKTTVNFSVAQGTPPPGQSSPMGSVVVPPASDTASKASSLARSARKAAESKVRVQPPKFEPCASASRQQQGSSLAARARGAGGGTSRSFVGEDGEQASTVGCVSLRFLDGESADLDRDQSEDYARSFNTSSRVGALTEVSSPSSMQRSQSGDVRGYRSPTRRGPTGASLANGSPANGSLANGSPASKGRSAPLAPGEDGNRQKQLAVSTCTGILGETFHRKGQPDLDVAIVLRGLRGIESLRLEACSLNDRWISSLCSHGGSPKWSTVRLLDLSRNDLSAASCQALASVVAGGLEVLVVDGNQIKAEGFEALCLAVRPTGKCGLRWLSVADNGIGHPGGFVAADLLSRPTGCPLQGLCLAQNPLSNGEMIAIFRALCRQSSSGGGNADASVEANLSSEVGSGIGRPLEMLDLSNCGVDSPGGPLVPQLSRVLAQCPVLAVDLRGCPLSTAAVRSVTNSAETGAGQHSGVPSELARFLLDGRLTL